MRSYKKIVALIFVVALAELIPYGFAKYIADFFRQFISQTGAIEYFLGALIHRSAQFILVLVLLKLLFKDKLSNLGFNLNNKGLSFKIITYVSILWLIVVFLFFIFSLMFVDGFSDYLSSKYPLNTGWIIALLSRDILLLDAFAEEILYRLFAILFLAKYWHGTININRWHISHATLLSVPIFVAAHVSLSIFPFKVMGYDPVQLFLTFFTGLLFAVSFEKTRNLFVPVILHGYTNLIITIAGYLTVIILK